VSSSVWGARIKVGLAGDESGAYVFPDFHPGLDGLFAMARLLEMLALSGRALDSIVGALPLADVAHLTVPCPVEAKGKVMRHLIEATTGTAVELIDGVKVRRADQWVAMIPDPIQPLFHMYAEPGVGTEALVAEFREVIQAAVSASEAELEVAGPGEVGA